MDVLLRKVPLAQTGIAVPRNWASSWWFAVEQNAFNERYENGEFSFVLDDGQLRVRYDTLEAAFYLTYRVPLVLPIRGGGAL